MNLNFIHFEVDMDWNRSVESDILMLANINLNVSWNVKLCSPFEGHGISFYSVLIRSLLPQSFSSQLLTTSLLSHTNYSFHHEDGGNRFLRNTEYLLQCQESDIRPT
jgi:hypothetical protein